VGWIIENGEFHVPEIPSEEHKIFYSYFVLSVNKPNG
jgi:hypothetical protein